MECRMWVLGKIRCVGHGGGKIKTFYYFRLPRIPSYSIFQTLELPCSVSGLRMRVQTR